MRRVNGEIALLAQSCGLAAAGLASARAAEAPPAPVPAQTPFGSGSYRAIMEVDASLPTQTLYHPADLRVRTSVIWNSGLFPQPTRMAGGGELTKGTLKALHAPIPYISGDDEDIAFANADDDFARNQNLPALRAYDRGVTHGGTYNERNGGEFAGVAVGWLNWQLKGDSQARHRFEGAECGLCVNPHWVVRSKNRQ